MERFADTCINPRPGEDIVAPDLAGWRRDRMPDYPDTAYVTLAPDWVCEVISSSTRKVDLHEKRPVCAREGVAHLWLVDPMDRTFEALELHDARHERTVAAPSIAIHRGVVAAIHRS